MIRNHGFWGWALAGAAMVLMGTSSAHARVIAADQDPGSPQFYDTGVTTNTSAAIVVFPKIRVDVGNNVDTVIQLTNTSEFLTRAHCFYVNATGHCSNNPSVACFPETVADDCNNPAALCIEQWNERDFFLTLTKRQPISWSASSGLAKLPLNDTPGRNGQFNEGSIPPVQEDNFIGELRCIQVDTTDAELPIARNDLKGEATIIRSEEPTFDAAKYNAIGIPAIDGAQDGNPKTLNIGGPQPEYNGCPNVLTMNHFFDGAVVETHDNTIVGEVNSRLTVVPCAADYLNQDRNLASATLQFLIYNEFEQRFSTSTRITCYRDVQLSDIDTRPGPAGNNFSIFSANVQGTLTGQTRIRSVVSPSDDGYGGNAVLAILTENWDSGTCAADSDVLCDEDQDCTDAGLTGGCNGASLSSSTSNIQFIGVRSAGDRIVLP